MAGTALGGGRTRRGLLRALFGLGVLGGTAAVLAPLVRAGRAGRVRPAAAAAGPDTRSDREAPAESVTEETYRGHHIRVRQGVAPGPAEAAALPPGAYPGTPSDDVLIDGRPLPVMRRADGGYLSAVNHYESFPTLVAAARAAVDDLRGAQLALDDPMLQHA